MVVEFIWKQPNLLQVSDVYSSYWRQVFSFFRIVADNLDFSLSARIQTSKLRNQSIHWTHHLAIRDRVITPCRDHAEATGQRKLMDLELSELLPSDDSNFAVESDFITLVSRILVKYLPAFSFLKDVVVHHIPHQYSKEMAQKSEVVSTVIYVISSLLGVKYLAHVWSPISQDWLLWNGSGFYFWIRNSLLK